MKPESGKAGRTEAALDFEGQLTYSGRVDLPELTATNQHLTVLDARHRHGTVEEGAGGGGSAEDTLFRGCGFLLVKHTSAVVDWTDHEEVKAKYYNEAHELVRRLLPSFTVNPSVGHIYRAEDVKENTTLEQGPALFVHNDYGDDVDEDGSVVNRWCDLTHGNDSETSNRRMVGVNLWRSVSGKPLARMPLAVLDRRTVDHDALLYRKNPGLHAVGNMSTMPPDDDHKWHYYPQMTLDEVLVFLTYDSDPQPNDLFGSEGAPFTPTMHTAVNIPDTDHLHQRESVEMRYFAYSPLPGR
mgnify:CR=1 FL=1